MPAVARSRRERWPETDLPDVPTVHEQGLAGLEAVGCQGLVAPAGVPREVIERFSAELRKLLARPDVNARFAGAGSEVQRRDATEFAACVKGESERWSALIKARKLQLD
jgi:tripartite-type tricarboxylate transporter receptor subunit TctC